MSQTVHQFLLRLGKHLGIYSFDPEAEANRSPLQSRGLREGDVDDLLLAVNGALQELWRESARVLRTGRWEGKVYAPQGVFLEVTPGSREITAFPGYQAWMRGGALWFEAGGWNELESETTLRHPFEGEAAGLYAATVFQRMLPLGRGVERLQPPLQWGERPVALCEEGVPEGNERGPLQKAKLFFDGPSREMALRLYPLPDSAGTLSAEGYFSPSEVTKDDVGVTNDPGVFFSLPAGWPESVLYPLALERLLTHPSFEPRSAVAEIRQQASLARAFVRAYGRTRSAEKMIASFR